MEMSKRSESCDAVSNELIIASRAHFRSSICSLPQRHLGHLGVYNLTIRDDGCQFEVLKEPANLTLCELLLILDFENNEFFVVLTLLFVASFQLFLRQSQSV